MTDKEVMQMALDALTEAELDGNCEYGATDALRTALAQPEPAQITKNWSVFNTGAEVWGELSLEDALVELTPKRLERGWSAVCVINKDNPPIYTVLAQPEQKEQWSNGYKAGYAQAQETDLAMPRKEWVGLPNDDVLERANKFRDPETYLRGVLWAEVKLKEKNGF